MKFNIDTYRFPEESVEYNLKISEDKIFFKGKDRWHDDNINIPELQCAYMVRWSDASLVLCLFDYMDHYISVSSKGFKKVYKEPDYIFGFDNESTMKTGISTLLKTAYPNKRVIKSFLKKNFTMYKMIST